MRRVMAIGFTALIMGALAACGDATIGETHGASIDDNQDSVHEFLLEENADNVTRGYLVTSNGRVSFLAIGDASLMTLRAQINGKTFDVTLDGSVTIDGHETVLTSGEKALLLTLSEELRLRLPTVTTGASRIEALATLGSYLSEAPAGYVHRRHVDGTVLPEGVAAAPGNSTRICLTTGKSYSTSYTARIGDKPSCSASTVCTANGGVAISSTTCQVSKTAVAGADWQKSVCGGGDYRCMGRCGAGCSGARYTLDCLKHDICSHDKASTQGGSDVSCGDEFSNASDDYWYGCTSSQ